MVIRNRSARRQPGESVKIEVVVKVVCGERDARTGGEDTDKRPASQGLAQSFSLLVPGSFPDGRNDEAIADIKIRVTPIQLRVGKKSVAKAAVPVARSSLQAIGEGRANIIQRVRPGVIRDQTQTSVVQVLRLELEVEGIVTAAARAAAHVVASVLKVWPSEAYPSWANVTGITRHTSGVHVGAVDRSVAQIFLAGTLHVDIVEV